MRYYPVKLERNLYAVSVCVLPVNVRALFLFALLFPVSDSFTPLDSVLKGGLSHWCVGLMPRVLHATIGVQPTRTVEKHPDCESRIA